MCVGGCFDDLVRAVHEDVECEPGLSGALRDSDGRLMEDQVCLGHEGTNQLAIPDVTVDQPDLPRGQRMLEVFPAAPDEVVQYRYVSRTGVHELIHDRRSDRPRAAGDKASLPVDHLASPKATGILAPSSSALRDAASR